MGSDNPPNHWLLAIGGAFLVAALIALLLDRHPSVVGSFGFFALIGVALAVFEPRIEGPFTASPGKIGFNLRKREARQTDRAIIEWRSGAVDPIEAIAPTADAEE